MTSSSKSRPKSKIELLIDKLKRPGGATIDDLVKTTGWQAHSVRGAMAGSLRKNGHTVTSEKVGGTRRYRLVEPTNG